MQYPAKMKIASHTSANPCQTGTLPLATDIPSYTGFATMNVYPSQ